VSGENPIFVWKRTETGEMMGTKIADLWGAVRKKIISDRFSTKTAIFARIKLSLLYLRRFSYLCFVWT